jgi:hypothetical protein
MFFLMRMAFWLCIVLILLPTGRSEKSATQVSAIDAVSAARATVSDMSGFCDRQPTACVVGAQTIAALGEKAQAGAKLLYEFLNDRTGSIEQSAAPRRSTGSTAVSAPGQNTLQPSDLKPDWRGPAVQRVAARSGAKTQ